MARKQPAAAPAKITKRTATTTPAAVERQLKRLADVEDEDQAAWHEPAAAAAAEYAAAQDAWERAIREAPNRTARRKVGKPPTLKLPEHPDFNKRTSDAIRGPVFGRFVVTGAAGQELAHDCYHATEACGVDAANPRTFVHYRDELAMAYPDAELHPACFDASRAAAAGHDG
jgi:hypothetical protein